MHFILQKNTKTNRLDIETYILEEELISQKFLHSYEIMTYEELLLLENVDQNKKDMIKTSIPVGTIEFVQEFLEIFYGINHMFPIEIPKEWRTREFLMRDYQITTYDKIPKNGMYFIKDVSKLKQFSYNGEMSYFMQEYDNNDNEQNNKIAIKLNKNHLFEVSQIIDIVSEYRVMVDCNKIVGIQFYDGNPLIVPNENHLKKLQKAVNLYSLNKTCPRAYAMDIAIFKENNKLEMAIIEMCPFVSLGTYGFVGTQLPFMYANGFQWYIENNQPIEIFSC